MLQSPDCFALFRRTTAARMTTIEIAAIDKSMSDMGSSMVGSFAVTVTATGAIEVDVGGVVRE